MSHHSTARLLGALAVLAVALGAGTAIAAATPAAPVAGSVDAGSLAAPVLRMLLSLGAVLALVAGLAWLARRLRGGARLRAGSIEIVSGVSLGAREKVVLLRVGQEQVLVGVSPAGMRALHVMKEPGPNAPFSAVLESQP